MNAAPGPPEFAAIVAVMMAFVPLIVLLMFAALFAAVFSPWLRGFLSGAPVSVFQILGMRLRGVPPKLVIDALVALVHRGHSHDPRLCYLIESTYLARRGRIQSAADLADMVEEEIKGKGESSRAARGDK